MWALTTLLVVAAVTCVGRRVGFAMMIVVSLSSTVNMKATSGAMLNAAVKQCSTFQVTHGKSLL